MTKKTEPTEVTNPSVEIVASVATPNLTNIPAIPEFKPAKLVTTSPEYSNTSTISEWGSQTLSKLGLNHFALIILCIFMVWRWTIKPKRKSYLDELHHAVQKHLTFCPKDSKLGVKLIDILPLIEQEVGRAQFLKMFDVSKLSKTDKAQAELALKYEKVPMEISTASPKEIQALFQAKRWNV